MFSVEAKRTGESDSRPLSFSAVMSSWVQVYRHRVQCTVNYEYSHGSEAGHWEEPSGMGSRIYTCIDVQAQFPLEPTRPVEVFALQELGQQVCAHEGIQHCLTCAFGFHFLNNLNHHTSSFPINAMHCRVANRCRAIGNKKEMQNKDRTRKKNRKYFACRDTCNYCWCEQTVSEVVRQEIHNVGFCCTHIW